MAKRRSVNRSGRVFVSQKVRDTFVISTTPRGAVSYVKYDSPRYQPFRSLARVFPYKSLRNIEDNRLWNPSRVVLKSGQKPRLLLSVRGLPTKVSLPRLVFTSNSVGDVMNSGPSPRLAVHAPQKVVMCIRRAMRKQVLFARGVAGSGRTTSRPVWSQESRLSCKG